MYLSVYHFDGDPTDLTPAYERLNAAFADVVFDLHVCVTTPTGLSVYDACPTREIAEAFGASAEFKSAVADAGLPEPRVERLGDVHLAVAHGQPVTV